MNLPRTTTVGNAVAREEVGSIYGCMIWLSHMKTTIDLNDDLLTDAKRRAAASGTTLKTFVEDALRARLLERPNPPDRFRLKLPIIQGTQAPAVEVTDRRTLYDFMEKRS